MGDEYSVGHDGAQHQPGPRLAEATTLLAVATDLGTGMPLTTSLRICLAALRIAELLDDASLDRGALIGAFGSLNFAGTASVFTGGGATWTKRATLMGSDEVTGDDFGWSVALDSAADTAVIGAPQHESTKGKGSAYVFTRSGASWAQRAKLTSHVRRDGDYFGLSVSIDEAGNAVAIGAPGGNSGVGFADVFTGGGSTWNPHVIRSPTASPTGFGGHLALSGSGPTAFVTAPGGLGTVYGFGVLNSKWVEKSSYTRTTGSIWANFGASLAVDPSGDELLVGAPSITTDSGTHGPGFVELLAIGTNTLKRIATLRASDGTSGDEFGWAVTVSSSSGPLLIGAIGASGAHPAGAVYVFTR
jgi:hypothetical protein